MDLQAVRDIRKLVIDLCRQHNGGHGGSAIGMAPMAVALWKHVMRYNPMNPDWFDRDRFVLSNGHAAVLLYAMLHISGHPHMSMDELRLYASAKPVDRATGKWKEALCLGHPEIHVSGVEVTTGPLGQGISNAVGLAIASRNLAATFNRPGHEVIGSHIYCVTGDGCLQEGVACEALAVAGNLGLDNLTLIYDNNRVTCDGPLDWTALEDTNAKIKALGWHVLDVPDGDGDLAVSNIVSALAEAKTLKERPTFINVRTTIGYGTLHAGTAKAHHSSFTAEDAAKFAPSGESATHTISSDTKKYFASLVDKGSALEEKWNGVLKTYSASYPELATILDQRMQGTVDVRAAGLLESMEVPDSPMATRQFNGVLFNRLITSVPSMIAGGADMWNSTNMSDAAQQELIFDRSRPSGRLVRYGIREHAMAAISNGIAAYRRGCFLPVTATFFMFYLYAAPGVRMGALSDLRVIHIATHDSIGEGQNGPTHQPVELDSLYRAMPNLQYIRPADPEEVIGAWAAALEVETTPSIISLAREPLLYGLSGTNRQKVKRGGYVLSEAQMDVKALVTLVSCGSDLQFAAEAARRLNDEGIPTRLVSMPCIELFEKQPQDYQGEVLSASKHIVSVESYVSTVWARFCDASVAMDSFGYSGSSTENYARFGMDSDGVVRKVKALIEHDNPGGKIGVSRRWRLLK
ncbi:Formaldehyde transketolase [Purpureocillium takamizusanense]|uniref:Formaldehyde transketolase n=1 Tax=Purpureocillium takamizusanense TaxID=2060973 RepID=A0A9Q8QF33_9HYPO|nr:Formaldehyde transketolase [Purpureocillium takamizusanense]UNI18435.1 Formaldehyde transketolase [Purpureocillium takamizusanense]